MIKQLLAATLVLVLSGGVFVADTPAADTGRSDDKASAAQRDAVKLCERLAGTEREICMRQAIDNRRITEQGGIGALPGGSITVDSKRSQSGSDAGSVSGPR